MGKLEEFIEKAKKCHKEELDYSKAIYINNRTPLCIIDPDYGEYWQTPSNHLKGQSHPMRKGGKISKEKTISQDEVIRRFEEVHKGENLDYSQVEYVNMHTKVKIIDPEYGEYWQEPVVHLKGCCHPQRGKEKQIKSMSYNTDKFVKLCKEKHKKDNYSYDDVDYKKSKEKVIIICNKIGSNGKPHGKFKISPDAFLQGKGCPICGNHLSIVEDEIYNEISNLIGKENIIQHDKTILEGKELDICIPSKNIAFEFNGLRWHSEQFNKDKNYHLNKTLKCSEKGIRLIHIFEDEYTNNKELIITKIKHILGYDNNKPSIFARKCFVREITNKEHNICIDFENKNHIQGFVGYTIAYGAFYNDKLIGLMTFKRETNTSNKWELNRFCTDINYKCPGVASRLLKTFINNYKPYEIKSFLDRRWCFNDKENLYTKLGFTLVKILKPDYYYTNGHGNRIHKFNFRKQILHKKYGLPLTMTESEMTKKIGYYKIWNCGLLKYVWKCT